MCTANDMMNAVRALHDDVFGPLLAGNQSAAVRLVPDGAPRVAHLPIRSLSLVDMLDLSREWHSRLEVINRAKSGRPNKHVELLSKWEPLFAAFSDRKHRLEVSCIVTGKSLSAHGSAMGHCVGGYAMDCLEGACHIVSFSAGSNPIATGEIRGSSAGGFRSAQLRGNHNSDPGDAVRSVCANLLAGLNRNVVFAVANEGAADGDRAAESEAAPIDAGTRVPMRLHVTSDEILEFALANRQAALLNHRAASGANYDISDPVAIDAVMVAWRFGLPDRMRAAWERGRTPEERCDLAREWLVEWVNKNSPVPRPRHDANL